MPFTNGTGLLQLSSQQDLSALFSWLMYIFYVCAVDGEKFLLSSEGGCGKAGGGC